MTEAEFRALAAQGYNRIPLVLESFADLDTPLSLYVKLANARYTFLLESVVGGERFGRYSFIGLPAEGAHPRARHGDRGRRRRNDRRAPRRRSAGVRRRVHAPLPRRAASRAAALLRRARRLFRLRHRPPHRDEARRPRAARRPGPRRRSRHSPAPHRGARRRRQPRGQDLPDRLRRSRRARRLRPCARAAAGAAPAAARAGVDSVPDRHGGHAERQRIRRRRIPAGGAAREGVHRRRRRDAGRAVAADAAPVHVVAAVALPRAALAQSVAVHVLLRLRRFPRGRRVAGDPGPQGGIRRSRCGRSPARGRAARRARPTRRSRASCSPIPRRSPST